jgi:subfamily B ATP-binding cassette protein MsbA
MSIAKRLIGYLKPYFPRFVQAGFCMASVSLLTTSLVWLIRTVVDDVLIAKDINKLAFIIAAIPVMYGLKGIFGYLQNYLMNYISQGVVRDIRRQLFVHLQKLSVDFYHRNSSGRILSVLTNDTQMLQSSIGTVPVQMIRDGLTLICLVGTIFYLHWKFALITVCPQNLSPLA